MSTALKVYLLTSVIILTSGFLYLFWRMGKLEKFANGNEAIVVSATASPKVEDNAVPTASPSDGCGASCQDFIKQEIETAIAGESAKLTPKPVATTTTTKQTTYIPISASYSTQSTDWKDVPGSEVYIDLNNDFSADAYVTWEANLSIANASGTADARLFDKTHGIAVQGSLVSVSSSDISQVKSGQIYPWSGNNQYIVQIKSLNSNLATFSSGRIKVVY